MRERHSLLYHARRSRELLRRILQRAGRAQSKWGAKEPDMIAISRRARKQTWHEPAQALASKYEGEI